jgi:hypothetical protein
VDQEHRHDDVHLVACQKTHPKRTNWTWVILGNCHSSAVIGVVKRWETTTEGKSEGQKELML